MIHNGAWRARAAAAALVAFVGLAACGAEREAESSAGDETPSSSSPTEDAASGTTKPAPPGTPDCSEIWQDGRKVPRFYGGCAEDGAYVKRDLLGCSSGQRMVTYADRYYAVLGGTVHEATQPLEQDSEYTAAVRRCRA